MPRDLGCVTEGKEFDVVVIVEGFCGVALLKEDEAPKFENSRRVLRVGITRARHAVRIVRPADAKPLFDPESRCRCGRSPAALARGLSRPGLARSTQMRASVRPTVY